MINEYSMARRRLMAAAQSKLTDWMAEVGQGENALTIAEMTDVLAASVQRLNGYRLRDEWERGAKKAARRGWGDERAASGSD